MKQRIIGKMTIVRAAMIAGGVEAPPNEATMIAAWQTLINSGKAWEMQEPIGSIAKSMINNGLCYPVEPKVKVKMESKPKLKPKPKLPNREITYFDNQYTAIVH